jgi:hypothetical protein
MTEIGIGEGLPVRPEEDVHDGLRDVRFAWAILLMLGIADRIVFLLSPNSEVTK